MKRVVGFGALNVDNIYQVENLQLEENSAKLIASQPGGSVANTISGLAKLGIATSFVGVVAQDKYGDLLLSDFAKNKVDTKKIIRISSNFLSSGLVEAYVDKRGRRLLFVKPGINDTLSSKDIDINFLKKALLVHFSSFVDDKQFILQSQVMQKISNFTKVSFSPGSLFVDRGLNKLKSMIKNSNILFLNRREVFKLAAKNFKQGASELVKLGPEIVVVTLGAEGCFIATKDQKFRQKTRKVKARDTTGAGDAFAAGFLFGIIQNYSLEKCAQIGNAVASFSIQRFGARAGLPNRKELASVVELPK